MNAFTIFGRMTLDDREYQTGLKRAEGETTKTASQISAEWKKVGDSLQKTGRDISLYVTAPIVGIGTAFVLAASDAEETVSKFNTIFRDLRDEADAVADKFAESFGLSSVAARQFLGDTSDLLTGFGFTAEAALDLAEEVNGLAIDLASFTNFSGGAEGASQALTKALLGETESAKSLGIVITQELVQARIEELRANGELLDATDAQAKAYATLQIAQEQSFNAIGDYARTSDSFANTTRRLAQEWNTLAVTFGNVLLPIATDLTRWAVDFVDRISELDDGTVRLIITIAGLAAAVGPVVLGIGRLVTGYGQLLVVLPRIIAGFATLRTTMLAFAGPAGLFILAATGVGVLISKLVGRNSLETSVDTAIEKASELSNKLGNASDQASVISSIQALADYVGPEGSPARTAFVNYANEIVATGDTAEEQFDRIKAAAFEAANAVELNALRTRLGTLQSQLAFEQTTTNITERIDSLTLSLEDNAAAHAETLARMQAAADRGNREAVRQLEQRLQSIESMRNELEWALAEAREASMSIGAEASAQRVERIERELAEVEFQIRTLSGATFEMENSASSASRVVAGTLTPALAQTTAETQDAAEAADDAADAMDRLTEAQLQYQWSRIQGDRGVIIAAGVAADAARAQQAAAEAAHLANLGEQYKAYQMGRVQSDRDARRQELENAAATTAELLARQQAEADALNQQLRLAQQGRLEASQSARQLAQDDLAFTLSMVERSYGPITSLDDAWRAFAQSGLTMTADMLTYLQERYEVVELSAFEVAQGNLELATSNVQVAETMQRLGQATQADVNDALIRQRDALVAVVAATTPFTAEWIEASNALADVNEQILTSSDLMVLAEQSSLRLVQAQYQLGQANREQVIASLQSVEAALLDAMNATEVGTDAWFDYLKQITDVRGEIANLKKGFIDLEKPFAGISDAAQNAASDIQGAFRNIAQSLSQLVLNFLDSNRTLEQNMQALASLAGGIAVNLGVIIGNVIGNLNNANNSLAQNMAEMALSVIQMVAQAVAAYVVQATVLLAMSGVPVNWWWAGLAVAAVAAATAGLAALRRMGATVETPGIEVEEDPGWEANPPSIPGGNRLRDVIRRPPNAFPTPVVGGGVQFPIPGGGGGGGRDAFQPITPPPSMGLQPRPEIPSQPIPLPDYTGNFGIDRNISFGATTQSVQLAVATPLVEASTRMLDAANIMNTVFGSMMPGQETMFGALPPFTSAIERMTPVLERLLLEGVTINTQMGAQTFSDRSEALRGLA